MCDTCLESVKVQFGPVEIVVIVIVIVIIFIVIIVLVIILVRLIVLGLVDIVHLVLPPLVPCLSAIRAVVLPAQNALCLFVSLIIVTVRVHIVSDTRDNRGDGSRFLDSLEGAKYQLKVMHTCDLPNTEGLA